jgi:hypothetical protein
MVFRLTLIVRRIGKEKFFSFAITFLEVLEHEVPDQADTAKGPADQDCLGFVWVGPELVSLVKHNGGLPPKP